MVGLDLKSKFCKMLLQTGKLVSHITCQNEKIIKENKIHNLNAHFGTDLKKFWKVESVIEKKLGSTKTYCQQIEFFNNTFRVTNKVLL